MDAMPYGGAPLVDKQGIQKPLLRINAWDNSDEHIHTRNERDAIHFRNSVSQIIRSLRDPSKGE
jgi:hypothetical protein